MEFLGLELRELHMLIVIDLLLIGGVIKIILQISSMLFELRLFNKNTEKQMLQTDKRIDQTDKRIAQTDRRIDQMEKRINQHENEFKEHRKEITELLKEIRDSREEMRLALIKK